VMKRLLMGGDDSFAVMKTWKEPSHVGAASESCFHDWSSQ